MDGLGGPVRRFIGLAMIIPPCLSLFLSLSLSLTHTHTQWRERLSERQRKKSGMNWAREGKTDDAKEEEKERSGERKKGDGEKEREWEEWMFGGVLG